MSRTPFDSFSKPYLEELLTPFGTVIVNPKIQRESRWVDLWFESAPPHPLNPAELGLLGRVSATPCVIKAFCEQPPVIEIVYCKEDLYAVFQEWHRQAEQEHRSIPDSLEGFPRLWILVSSASEALLETLRVLPDLEWPAGVYVAVSRCDRMAVIAMNQLPSTPDTLWIRLLWVRLLGKGKKQQQAIAETLSLGEEDERRERILQLLMSWKISMEITGTFAPGREALG